MCKTEMYEEIHDGKVTIAIPTVNRQDLILQTVDSALSQSYSDIEIIISNNASTDDTSLIIEQIRDPRVRTFSQPSRLDMVASWNFCLSKASGEWFLLLSDDDLLEPTALEELLRPLVRDQASMSYSPFVVIDGSGLKRQCSRPGPALSSGAAFIRNHLSRRLMVMPSGVLGRTDELRTLGGFPNIGTTSDLGLRLLLASTGSVACSAVPLVRYRVHSGNLSGQFTAVIASHEALSVWARERVELEPYLNAISVFVWRGVTGFGVRSSLNGESEGVYAALQVIKTSDVSFWRKGVAHFAIWIATTAAFRAVMGIRDRWIRGSAMQA